MKKTKKIIITILGLAILSLAAAPAAQAKFYDFRGMGAQLNKFFYDDNGYNSMLNMQGLWGMETSSNFRNAEKSYAEAFNRANKDYNVARKVARQKLIDAIKSAGNNYAQRLAAYKTYMNDLLAAYRVKTNAEIAAMQAYIDALGNIQTNQAPTANNQSVALNENSTKAITLTGSDPQNSTLTFTVVSNPAHGTLSGTVPNLTYTPNTNYSGSDSFTFKVSDGSLYSNIATVSITVTNVNQAPVANAQSITVAKNNSKSITLTGSDADGNTLSFYVVSNPAHGTLSGTVPNLTYLPATDYTGSDSFTFKVNDKTVDSAITTISITVQ